MAEAMKFGQQSFEVKLPPQQIAAELEPNRVELPQRTPAEHIRWALDHPIDSKPLKELVKPGETVCIIISDVTRRWQSPETYIPVLIAELEAAGVRDEDMLIISATGTHREQTREEHIGLVTQAVYDRIRLVDHRCTDEENLKYVGTTSRGTPVYLDKRALECDHIILTGGVVYHFMAGFGGGRKSILPGIAGRETIMKNHNLALNPGLGAGSNPEVRSANLSVVVSFTHVLPVVYAGVLGGIADTDPQLLEMARVYRLPLITRLRYIWLPGIFPSFCESCIAAMGMCWKSGVSAEVIGLPDHSVGDALYRAKITLSTPDVFAWTLVIVLLSALLSTVAARLLRAVKVCLCGEVQA